MLISVHSKLSVLLLLLACSAQTAANFPVNETTCDRYRSRKARVVVQDYLLPKAEKLDYTLPESCLVHPQRNIYEFQEPRRVPLQRGVWKCGFCGQQLRSSHHLDDHLDNVHHDMLHQREDSVCLADLCTALHCDFFTAFVAGHTGYGFDDAPCRETIVQKYRKQCEDVADSCFPPEHSEPAKLLHGYMMDSFCKAHTCHKPTHRQMLHKIVKSHKKFHMGYRVFAVIVFLFMLVFYVVLWLYYRAHSGYHSQNAVRRLHPKQKSIFDPGMWFGKRKKQF